MKSQTRASFSIPWNTITIAAVRFANKNRENPSTFFDQKGKMEPMIREKSPLYGEAFVREDVDINRLIYNMAEQ